MLLSREEKRIPWTRESIVLALLVLWMTITTFFATFPDLAWQQWEKVAKIQLMIFVAMMLITTRERLHLLVWTIALSIGFFGVKAAYSRSFMGACTVSWGRRARSSAKTTRWASRWR